MESAADEERNVNFPDEDPEIGKCIIQGKVRSRRLLHTPDFYYAVPDMPPYERPTRSGSRFPGIGDIYQICIRHPFFQFARFFQDILKESKAVFLEDQVAFPGVL